MVHLISFFFFSFVCLREGGGGGEVGCTFGGSYAPSFELKFHSRVYKFSIFERRETFNAFEDICRQNKCGR